MEPLVETAFNINCKSRGYRLLALRNEKVILTERPDAFDNSQKWYKYPSSKNSSWFAFVNKDPSSGKLWAIQHPSDVEPQAVRVTSYSPDNDSIMWTEQTISDAYGYTSAITSVRNTDWFLDSFGKDGVLTVGCVRSNVQSANDDMRWSFKQCVATPPTGPIVKVYCKDSIDSSIRASDNIYDVRVFISSPDPYDTFQQWHKVEAKDHVNNDDGYPCFVLVNKATGLAIKHASHGQPVKLERYSSVINESIVWTERNLRDGYKSVRVLNDTNLAWDRHDNYMACYGYDGHDYQRWFIAPLAPLPLMGIPVRVYSMAASNLCLALRNNKVVLIPNDKDDMFQLWYKDEVSTQVNDTDGHSIFALVNKATGQAIKHPTAAHFSVGLIPFYTYNDKSILWTERYLNDGSKSIRVVNNTSLTLNAHSDQDDFTMGVSYWNADCLTHRWMIEPCEPLPSMGPPVRLRVYSKNGSDYVFTIRDEKVVLTKFNPYDILQAWYKDIRTKDSNGFPCFAFVNKATGFAVQCPTAPNQALQLTAYNPNTLDKSVLWTERELSDGYRAIGLINDTSGLTWDAYGGASDGVVIGFNSWHDNNNNQRWLFAPY